MNANRNIRIRSRSSCYWNKFRYSDAKVFLRSDDISDLKGDISSLKIQTNDLENAVNTNSNSINNINCK
jgi:hypothetical protein